MILYTIGFAQKSAESFFGLLRDTGVERLVDIRLNPKGQLSGFAPQEDLAFFLHHLANSCEYVHMPVLAPTAEILGSYREDHAWDRYADRFQALLDERRVPEVLARFEFEDRVSCMLCSEATPDRCHRRLVAERLARAWGGLEIIHL